MEEIIRKKLCSFCLNNKKNCKLIEKSKQGTCIVYRCLNYRVDVRKIQPYEKFKYIIKSNNDKMKNKALAGKK